MPLRDKIMMFNEIQRATKRRLPMLQHVPTNKLNGIVRDVNKVVASIPTSTIDELHLVKA